MRKERQGRADRAPLAPASAGAGGRARGDPGRAAQRARALRAGRALGLAGALLGCACATRYTPFEVDGKLGKAVAAASGYLDRERSLEAEQLLRSVERIDPEYYGLPELLAKLPAGDRDLFRATLLGVNRARRYPRAADPGRRLLLYLPDRLLDTLDLFDIEAHGGAGLYAGLHVTERLRAAAGARVVGGTGVYFPRSLFGTRVQGDAALHAFGAGPLRSAGITAGTGGVTSAVGDRGASTRPSDPLYQNYLDYWSIGGSATLGFFGASGELHLVQLLDWIGGFAGFDFGRDDLATTQPMDLRRSDVDLLQELAEIERSPELLAEYRERRPQLRPRQEEPARPGQIRQGR